MKKINIVFLIVQLFLLAGCNIKQERKQNEIKVGAVLPLSGDVAVYGKNTKEGIDLAVEQINNSGGINGKLIRVIYEDSKADPKIAVSVAQKLINIDNVQAIIDNSVSSVALAIAPIANKNKVVLLSTGSTNPKLSGISPYFFRIWNSDALEGKVAADFVFDSLKIQKVAIAYVNNEYGNGLAEVFKRQLLSRSGSVVACESFEQNSTNYKDIITKLKTLSFDCIYIVAYPKEIGAFLKQKVEMGLVKQVVGTVTMEDEQIIKIAGNASENVIYPFPATPNSNDSNVARFQSAFEKKYNKKPGITSDVGYDAIFLLSKALRLSNDITGDYIRLGLKSIKNYHGASGIIQFDENGDVNKPFAFKIIKNKKFQQY
jgi:branched-chain amino acid transport system substrate-binding protein